MKPCPLELYHPASRGRIGPITIRAFVIIIVPGRNCTTVPRLIGEPWTFGILYGLAEDVDPGYNGE